MLSFRHDRRLTLQTSCLLMGRVVPVSVFEECRSDFWCEAAVPAALTSADAAGGGGTPCPVGLRVPKECIPLILDDSHPMRMQTILDDADLRHLSVLIADRLKLCRIGSARRRAPRSYHFWLDGALGGDNQSATRKASAGAGGGGAGVAGVADGDRCDDGGQSGREFKLSLRKRSVGQVVFSRLVSFWVPSTVEHETIKERDGTRAARETREDQQGDRTAEAVSPPAGRFVKRLVVVKEFAHRGECGELRGHMHDPDSGGGAETLVLSPGLTRTLLRGWPKMSRQQHRNKNRSARYWRDALTWRLGIVPEPPPVRSSNVHEQNADANATSFEGVERTAPAPSDSPENGECRMTADDRVPMFSLRRVTASLAIPLTGVDESSDEVIARPDVFFDLLVLPPHPEPRSPKRKHACRQNPSIELVVTHRQTMAIFRFSISIKAFARGLDAVVAACLVAPTALSTELELPTSSNALRDLAGTWLRYSPGDSRRGRQPTLTLSFPRMKAVVAEPRVSLRCYARNASVGRKRCLQPDGTDRPEDGTVAAGEELNSSRQAVGRKRESQEAPGSVPRRSKRRSSHAGIATLQVETRNERMVFRRSVDVSQSGDAGTRRLKTEPPAPEEREEQSQEGRGAWGLSPKVLAISVYEAFTAGPSGKIERHLRFCARDESVRPVIEASTTVPWVGTCEGVEGGKLWRVVTEGLTFKSVRDETRKTTLGMRLHVSIDFATSETMVPSHDVVKPERRGSGSPTSAGSSEAYGSETGRRSMTAIASEEAAVGGPVASDGGGRQILIVPPGRSPERVGHELSNTPESRQMAQEQAVDEVGDLPGTRDRNEEGRPGAARAIGSQQLRDKSRSSVDCLDSRTPHLLGAGGQRGAALTVHRAHHRADRTGRLYGGWHQITGIRLHVQCFQERQGRVNSGIEEAPDDGRASDNTPERTPAGRGGAIGIPSPATLRFLVCDPRSGYRTEVSVSADDVRRNLSADGGIVETGLLEAGRRPALAKAIAQKLRLVFDADGGYRVVLPLPVEWNRQCPQAG